MGKLSVTTLQSINVEVAYARPDTQVILPVELAVGATVAEAIQLSGILQQFPEIDLQVNPVGIFSRKVVLTQVLKAGDRVEIYRPLQIDPKEARRNRASKNKT